MPITVAGGGGGGGGTKPASTTTGKVKPGKPKVGHKVKVEVAVTGADGSKATGQVVVKVKGKDAITVDLVNGRAVVNLGKFNKRVRRRSPSTTSAAPPCCRARRP